MEFANGFDEVIGDMKENKPNCRKAIDNIAVFAEIVPVKNILHFFSHIIIIQYLALFSAGFFEDSRKSHEDNFGV